MDNQKVGALIYHLRKEKGMTQIELANLLLVSDRTISKWERGIGCPDISLLHNLSNILHVDIEKLLLGDLAENPIDGGNMKKIKFYVCPTCDNMMTCTGNSELSCCGRKLTSLHEQPMDDQHQLHIQDIDDEYLISFHHDMTKDHYISFLAYVTYNKVLITKLYPEQASEVRIPKMYGGYFLTYCTKHGLYKHGKVTTRK